MAGEISYKSYCWAVGTTSYRTDNFNLNIELQLKLMDEFRSLPELSLIHISHHDAQRVDRRPGEEPGIYEGGGNPDP